MLRIKKLEVYLWGSQSIRWRNSIAETTVKSIQAVGAVSGCDHIRTNQCHQQNPRMTGTSGGMTQFIFHGLGDDSLHIQASQGCREGCVSETSAREQEPQGPQRDKGLLPFLSRMPTGSTILHLRFHLPKEKRTNPYKKKPIDSRQTTSIFTHRDSFELGESVFSFLPASVWLMFSTLLGVGRVVLQKERHDY